MDADRIAGAAKQAAGKVEKAVGEALDDNTTRATGEVRSIGGAAQEAAGRTRDMLRSAGDTVADMADDAMQAGQEAAHAGRKAIASNVREYPGSSLLVAGLVGFAIGIMMTRRPPPPRRRWSGWN